MSEYQNQRPPNDGFEEVSGGDLGGFWSPKSGDDGQQLEGTLTRIEQEFGKFGNPCAFIDVEEPDGSIKTIGVNLNAMLNDLMMKVPIGFDVRITFVGMAKAKNGNEYKNFKVAKKPPTMKEVVPHNQPVQVSSPTTQGYSPTPPPTQHVQQPAQPQVQQPQAPQQQAIPGLTATHVPGIYQNAAGFLTNSVGVPVDADGKLSQIPVPVSALGIASAKKNNGDIPF